MTGEAHPPRTHTPRSVPQPVTAAPLLRCELELVLCVKLQTTGDGPRPRRPADPSRRPFPPPWSGARLATGRAACQRFRAPCRPIPVALQEARSTTRPAPIAVRYAHLGVTPSNLRPLSTSAQCAGSHTTRLRLLDQVVREQAHLEDFHVFTLSFPVLRCPTSDRNSGCRRYRESGPDTRSREPI